MRSNRKARFILSSAKGSNPMEHSAIILAERQRECEMGRQRKFDRDMQSLQRAAQKARKLQDSTEAWQQPWLRQTMLLIQSLLDQNPNGMEERRMLYWCGLALHAGYGHGDAHLCNSPQLRTTPKDLVLQLNQRLLVILRAQGQTEETRGLMQKAHGYVISWLCDCIRSGPSQSPNLDIEVHGMVLEALHESPTHPLLLSEIGELLVDTGKIEEGFQSLQMAVRASETGQFFGCQVVACEVLSHNWRKFGAMRVISVLRDAIDTYRKVDTKVLVEQSNAQLLAICDERYQVDLHSIEVKSDLLKKQLGLIREMLEDLEGAQEVMEGQDLSLYIRSSGEVAKALCAAGERGKLDAVGTESEGESIAQLQDEPGKEIEPNPECEFDSKESHSRPEGSATVNKTPTSAAATGAKNKTTTHFSLDLIGDQLYSSSGLADHL